MKVITYGSRVFAGVARSSPGTFLSPLHDLIGVRTMATKAITVENINPNILRLEYAVRGPLVIRATEIEKELEKVSFYCFLFTNSRAT